MGRRRGWTDDDKVRIVEESLRGVRQAAATARRHGISRSLLTRWRREFREGLPRAEGPLGFTPLQIAPDVPRPVREEACRSQAGQDRVEVVLTDGRRLVIGASVDLAMLARLVQVLERVSGRREGLARRRRDRHALRHEQPGAEGPGGARARPAWRRDLLLPGSAVAISAARVGYLLDGIDWRNPRWTQRPAKAG